MRKTLLVLLMSFTFTLYGQTYGKVTYLATLNKDSIQMPSEALKEDMARYEALQMIHGSHPVESYLVFCDSIALYRVEPKIDIPGWQNVDGKITITKANLNLTWVFAGGESLHYTDWSRDWDIAQKEVFFERKRIKYEPKQWINTTDTKTILGYTCFKAKLQGTKIEAWYTTELKVKHGPRGYNGLPGLVLEVKQNRFLLKAIDVDLTNNEYEVIEEPIKGTIMPESEYKQLGKTVFSKD